MDIFLIIFTAAVGVTLASIAWSSISFAPFVSTKKRDLNRIRRLLDLKKGEKFYELGCGDGKLAIELARNTEAQIIGVEIVWPLWLVCEIRRVFLKNRRNLNFKWGNLFNQDLRQADAVYVFGMPHSIKNKLAQKLDKELRPGARVVSYAFHFPGWKPLTVEQPESKDVAIYIYRR